ncbi:MAG: hypothetical protein WA485_06075 [Candidatus Sulfotelmatobacter sp.]
MNNWDALKIAIRTETDVISASSGHDVSLSCDLDADANRLWIKSQVDEMKVEYDSERNAVRWEKANEYGYDHISEPVNQLAITLVRRVQSTE